MFKIQKSVLCVIEDFKYFRFIFLSNPGTASPRAVRCTARSIVQNDKFRGCTLAHYYVL